jgi:hypothetical protein
VSLQVYCDSQQELDAFWQKLSAGGDSRAQQCGWLKDKFGLSWPIISKELPEPRPLLGMVTVERLLKVWHEVGSLYEPFHTHPLGLHLELGGQQKSPASVLEQQWGRAPRPQQRGEAVAWLLQHQRDGQGKLGGHGPERCTC